MKTFRRRPKVSDHRDTYRCAKSPAVPTAHAPGGATLTEVLMSILVMGIGVLSVVTLFPASFLRTLQATNITHSTILRYNADALIDLDRTNRSTVFPYWQPNTAYALNDIVLAQLTPTGDNRRYRCTAAGTSDSPGPPPWDTTVGNTTTEAGGVQWICEDHSRYVIDPLGWNLVDPAFTGVFGNDGTAAYVPAAPNLPLERFNANAVNIPLADSLATLPDSWTFQLEGVPTAFTANTVTMPAGVDLAGISYYDPAAPPATIPPGSRVILTDVSGKVSHTRFITSIAAPTITWSAADPLPAGFTPVAARIETQERRYTWLLTVRRSSSGIPSVSVVVFFRRSLGAEDERVFTVSNVNGRELTIDHTPGPNSKAPFAKKGGFLLDIDSGRWYRIQDSTAWTATSTRVTLDQAPLDPVASVIIPRGIVDVFSIESKP